MTEVELKNLRKGMRVRGRHAPKDAVYEIIETRLIRDYVRVRHTKSNCVYRFHRYDFLYCLEYVHDEFMSKEYIIHLLGDL